LSWVGRGFGRQKLSKGSTWVARSGIGERYARLHARLPAWKAAARKPEADSGQMISALEWVTVLTLAAAAISALTLVAATIVEKLRRSRRRR